MPIFILESRPGSPTDSGTGLRRSHMSREGVRGLVSRLTGNMARPPSFLPPAAFCLMLTWGKSTASARPSPLPLQHCGLSAEVGCPRSGKEAKSPSELLRTQLEVARLAEKKRLADNVQLTGVFFGFSFFLLRPAPRNSLFFALQKLLAQLKKKKNGAESRAWELANRGTEKQVGSHASPPWLSGTCFPHRVRAGAVVAGSKGWGAACRLKDGSVPHWLP